MVGFIIVITQFRVTTATSCRALTRVLNVIYVEGHERASSLLLQCTVSVSTGNILMWVCVVYYIKERVYD
jgi:hypothetical protein